LNGILLRFPPVLLKKEEFFLCFKMRDDDVSSFSYLFFISFIPSSFLINDWIFSIKSKVSVSLEYVL
jgi:hypothetical protein